MGESHVTSPVNCLKCGAPCCPSCAFALESGTYCAQCAESILDAEGGPLSLAAPAGYTPAGSGAEWSELRTSGDNPRWVILVARDQPDLFAHMVRAFGRDRKVEVIIDRRKDYARNPPGMEDRLRTHGAAVIKRRWF